MSACNCKHVFTKGLHRGETCTIIPQNSEEYCYKHRSYKHAIKHTVVKKNSRGTTRGGTIMKSVRPVNVFTNIHDIPDSDRDIPNDLGDNYQSCHDGTTITMVDDYDWWEEHVYVPPMDSWGSDCCTWSPSVVLY